ncbi:Cytochrome P450 71D8 [Zea mays]|uniref:Cytochrome P450 71D8 n=1 Tax=Zea mays TaxID=4577 RepID=A0A3L6EFC4_MAIZE|nr:Cytochrome P450 71D8 [Zea mays]
MEQASHYLCLFLALILPLLLLRLLRGRRSDSGVRLPPGPWRLPVIGSLHHLVGKPLVHRAFADLARRLDAPLMYLRLGEVPVVVATSRDAAREVLRTNDVTFATRPWSPTMKIMMQDGLGMVFAPYGDHWRQLRKISILELLSARRVQSFRHVREDEVARLVAAVAATAPGQPVNVSHRIAVLVADSAVRAMIGDRFSRRDEFLVSLEEGLKLVSGFSLGDLFPSSPFMNFLSGTARRAHANHRKNFELMECAIKQHEERRAQAAVNGAAVQEEAEDLVDVLLRIQKDGGLDMPLTMGIIKAVILGTTVFVNAWAIGRDPEYWDDAEEFKPERFECGTVDFKGMDFEYIPFGAGRRICPGMVFAQSNIELALAALLYHFDWKLEEGLKPSELDMTEDIGLTVRKKNDLLLHPSVRVPHKY